MNIVEEYKRLKVLLETEEGFKKVEEAWMIGLNHKMLNGQWIEIEESMGNKAAAFAIDSIPLKWVLGKFGGVHAQPYQDLINLYEEDNIIKSLPRLLKGYATMMKGFEYPLIMIDGPPYKRIEEIEKFILYNEIGLPIRTLFDKV